MSKYKKLDAAILNKIGGHPVRFAAILVRDVTEECKRIGDAEGTSRSHWGVSPFNICDRRLQALRKAGKIRSTTKGWVRVASNVVELEKYAAGPVRQRGAA